MKEYKDKIITVRISARACEMLDNLKEDTGALSESEIIRLAIHQLYLKHHKSYIPTTLVKSSTKAETPKEKLTQVQKIEKEQFDICYALEGEIVEKNGAKNCKYKTYELINPSLVESYENQVPFSMLERHLIQTQYSPSKDECLKLINE
jgi:hypothetical protein